MNVGLVGLAAAAVLALPAAAASQPGVIAFSRTLGVDATAQAIFVIRPDGSGLRRLTPSGRSEGEPAVSPDGRRIATAATGIVIRTTSGKLIRRIPARRSLTALSWSPGGRWIAYLSERCTSGGGGRDLGPLCADLWLVRPDGRVRRRLVDSNVHTADLVSHYAWSPDGRRIVFERYQPAGLAIVDVASGRIRRLGHGDDPAWSRSGMIAFTRQRGPFRGSDLYVARLNGSGLRKACRAQNAERPVFSPDGKSVAFLDYRPNTDGTRWLVRVLGSDRRCRTVGIATEHWTLRWSPDGSQLLWESFGERLMVGRADGRGRPRFLTRGSTADWG